MYICFPSVYVYISTHKRLSLCINVSVKPSITVALLTGLIKNSLWLSLEEGEDSIYIRFFVFITEGTFPLASAASLRRRLESTILAVKSINMICYVISVCLISSLELLQLNTHCFLVLLALSRSQKHYLTYVERGVAAPVISSYRE